MAKNEVCLMVERGSIRLLFDRLFIRSASGELLRRCTPRESIAIVKLANELASQSEPNRYVYLPDGEVKVYSDNQPGKKRRYSLTISLNNDRRLVYFTAGDLSQLRQEFMNSLGLSEYRRRQTGFQWSLTSGWQLSGWAAGDAS